MPCLQALWPPAPPPGQAGGLHGMHARCQVRTCMPAMRRVCVSLPGDARPLEACRVPRLGPRSAGSCLWLQACCLGRRWGAGGIVCGACSRGLGMHVCMLDHRMHRLGIPVRAVTVARLQPRVPNERIQCCLFRSGGHVRGPELHLRLRCAMPLTGMWWREGCVLVKRTKCLIMSSQ